MQSFPTYWSTTIYVNDFPKVCSGDKTLSEALSRAMSDAIYYQAMYPDCKISIREIEESCARCHNTGKVQQNGRRVIKMVRCPECRGKCAHGRLDDIPILLPDPPNGVRIVQGSDSDMTI